MAGISLICPFCRDPLKDYYCAAHGQYRLAAGIPLLAANPDSQTLGDTFNLHWTENADRAFPRLKLQIAEHFLRPVLEMSRRRGPSPMRILDAGTGDGVHAEVLHRIANLAYVGLDISLEALVKLQETVVHAGTLIQGDVLALPFPDQTFDVVFSFGVLGYTSNPEQGFRELCRVTRPGGLIGLWLYPKRKGLMGWLFERIRWLCRKTGPRGTRLLAGMIVPFLFFLPTRSKVNLLNASWKQCLEVVMVNIAPENLFLPTPEHVRQWFTANQVQVILEDLEEPITLWGEKR